MARLGELDLNLLLPLAALLDERHVSRAAVRAGLSQPAMSRALGRLRQTFGDELLVRAGGGYELTPRAERLHRQLGAVLPRLEELAADAPFVAATAAETFRVAGADYGAHVLVGRLVRRFFAASPGSQLRLSPWRDGLFDDLAEGRAHLVFRVQAPPSPLRAEELFSDDFVCVLAADHPLAGAEVDWAAYVGARHVEISDEDTEPGTRRRLAPGWGARRIGLVVPSVAAALPAVAGSALVATLPRRMLTELPPDPALAIVEAPREIGRVTYRMVWHPRLDDDPPHRWLRETVRAAAAELRDASDA